MSVSTEGKTGNGGPEHGAAYSKERLVGAEYENPSTSDASAENQKAGRVIVDAPRNPLEPSDDGPKAKMKESGRKVADKAREAGEKAKTKGRQKAYGLFGEGKQQAASSLENTAQAFYRIGDQFRKNDQEGIGQYAERASAQIQGFSDYLSEREPDAILRDVQDAARRRPWIAIGGAFIAGLATARFLKASKRQ